MTEESTLAAACSRTSARRRLIVVGASLTLCLWAFSIFHFGGQLGKWLDDYSLSVRDPATGAYSLPVWYWKVPPFASHAFFYRPLHLTWMYNAHTLLWNQDRVLHLVNALCHLVVVLLLWRLLSRLTRDVRVPIAGALLFLVFPMNYEVVFWPSALSGGIATATLLLLLNVYCRYVRGGERGRWLIVMAGLAFLIPCWNEQPASGVAALPLLYLALRNRGESPRRRFAGIVAPWLLCGLACTVYILLVRGTAPDLLRGSKGSMVPPTAVPERVTQVAGEVRQRLFGPWIESIAEGGFRQGWQRVTAASSVMPWAILLAVAFAFWWGAWVTHPGRPDSPPRTSARPLWAMLFGLASFVLSWVPIVAVRGQNVESRMCYYPTVCLVIALAALADAIVVHVRLPRWVAGVSRGTTGLALLVLCLACGLSLVGIQDVYRTRYAMDQAEMAQLRQLAPTPATDSVFVPLLLEDRPARTGVGIFDHFAVPALGTPWSAEAIVRQAYRRGDLTGVSFGWWTGCSSLSECDAAGFLCRGSGRWIDWRSAVPFVVDRQGHVSLVDTISTTLPGGDELVVPLPHVRELTVQRGLAEHPFALDLRG